MANAVLLQRLSSWTETGSGEAGVANSKKGS